MYEGQRIKWNEALAKLRSSRGKPENKLVKRKVRDVSVNVVERSSMGLRITVVEL